MYGLRAESSLSARRSSRGELLCSRWAKLDMAINPGPERMTFQLLMSLDDISASVTGQIFTSDTSLPVFILPFFYHD